MKIDARALYERFVSNAQARGYDPKSAIMELFALFAEAFEIEIESAERAHVMNLAARSGTIYDSSITPIGEIETVEADTAPLCRRCGIRCEEQDGVWRCVRCNAPWD